MTTIIETTVHYPPGVTKVLGFSFSHLIGYIDSVKVIKYPKRYNESVDLELKISAEARRVLGVESEIYNILGSHTNIIGFQGGDENGVYLEYAVNGSVLEYLQRATPCPSTQQRIKWSQQAAKALAHCHSCRVIHCDMHPRNLLLDASLNAKLSDFQGRHLSPDGTILIDGHSREDVKSRMPRPDFNTADEKTDIFALGSTIYHILKGHEPFPELDPDEDEEEVERLWQAKQFPSLESNLGGLVVHRCWGGMYKSAAEVAEDLDELLATF